jgi:transcriptional regulator with XRE-family HTH domain
MKYLKQFNQRLRKMRETRRLSQHDIAAFCLVDPSVVESWETEQGELRCYPTLDNLLDLCFKTGTALESFIDIPMPPAVRQLGLPGINLGDETDLADSLSDLDEQIARFMPAADETELLRRYRKSDPQTKELILQLIAS